LIKGSIPGSEGDYVILREAKKMSREIVAKRKAQAAAKAAKVKGGKKAAAKPAETKPAETKPAEAKAAEAKPAAAAKK